MPTEAILGYLRYRVVNRITGAEITRELPHIHQSTWQVRGMQPGAPGATVIGGFKIPLHPPLSDGYMWAQSIYDQLDYGLRVEGYIGDVVAGAPRFAGIIRQIRRSYESFEIVGSSDLYVLQASRAFQGETYGSPTYTVFHGSDMWSEFASIVKSDVNDEFNPYTSGNYSTIVGTWAAATDDNPVTNAVTCSAGTDSLLLRTSSLGGSHQQMMASGRLSSDLTDATNAGRVGVVFYNDATHFCVARATIKSGGNVDVDAYKVGNGAGVVWSGSVSNFLTAQPSPFRFQISFVLYPGGGISGQKLSKMLLNGRDTGLGGADVFTGQVGLYFSAPASGAASAYFHEWAHKYREPAAFSAGSVAAGAAVIPSGNILSAGQTHLDLMNAGADLEGFLWRYTPAAYTSGDKLGTVDLGTTVGTDLSGSIRFEEGIDLIDLQQDAPAELFSSVVRVAGIPGSTGGGVFTYDNTAAMAKWGVLEDVVATVTRSDLSLLRRASQALSANKALNTIPRTARVVRSPRTAEKFRDMDYVTIHAPRVGVFYQKVLVVGYDFTEGSPEMTLYLDQYGMRAAQIAILRNVVTSPAIAGLFATR